MHAVEMGRVRNMYMLSQGSPEQVTCAVFFSTLPLPPLCTFIPHSGGAVRIAGGVLVAVIVLLTLLGLTVGVGIGVFLCRRAQVRRKGEPPERRERPQKMSRTSEVGGATEQPVCARDDIYDDVEDLRYTDGGEVLYQMLDTKTQEYSSVYAQLREEMYKKLDPQSREREHHYQSVNEGRK